MRLLVCGSRDYGVYDIDMSPHEKLSAIQDSLFLCYTLNEYLDSGLIIISGAAKGADTQAAAWARVHNVTLEEYPADWKQYGRSAGPIRNKQMLVEGKPDMVLAFSNDFEGSKGTKNLVEQAKKAGIPTKVMTRHG